MKQEIEVMHVLRVPPLGKLEIEANEARYTNLAEVNNPKIRQRILAAIGELVDFCGGYSILEDAGVVPHLTPIPELKQQQAAFLASLQRQVEAEKNKPQTQGRTGSMFTADKSAMDAQPMIEISETGDVVPVIPVAASKPLTIAEQINEILQKNIATHPEMANRGIRLEQHPTGGLQILVDGKQYEKPGDIEDQAVQALIKSSVKEWNAAQ
jgi:hypothetical protein